MAYIEEANELMTDATGQSIATAIGNMSSTSVGNLAALQTTDKTSLVGAVNEVKSGLTSVTLADLPTLYATKCGGTVVVHFINTAFTPASDDLSTLIGSNNKPSKNDISIPVIEVATGNVLILTYKITGIVEVKSTQGVLIDHSAAVYGTLVFNA